jgi:DNA-binding GntR family transcriptional regulator
MRKLVKLATGLKERAYQYIRQELTEGHWPAGRFLSMVQVAKTIGMSYTPVREAIIQLETEGMVETIPRVGVRPRQVGRKELEHIFEVRMVVESGAAELAAKRISPDQLDALRKNLEEHHQALLRIRQVLKKASEERQPHSLLDRPGMESTHELNNQFHTVIMQASGNPQLIKILSDLRIPSRMLRIWAQFPGIDYLHQLTMEYRFHYRTYRALAKKDGLSAGMWIKKHIADALEYYVRFYDWLEQVNRSGLSSTLSDPLSGQVQAGESDNDSLFLGDVSSSEKRPL